MNPVSRILASMTRLLWPLGFGRPPEPPTEDVHPSSRAEQARVEDAPKPERHTEIPPDQQHGGGFPHR